MKRFMILCVLIILANTINGQKISYEGTYSILRIEQIKGGFIVVAESEKNDTIRILSEKRIVLRKDLEKIKVGNKYFLKLEKIDIDSIASSITPGNFSIRFKGKTIWVFGKDSLDDLPYHSKNLKGLYVKI